MSAENAVICHWLGVGESGNQVHSCQTDVVGRKSQLLSTRNSIRLLECYWMWPQETTTVQSWNGSVSYNLVLKSQTITFTVSYQLHSAALWITGAGITEGHPVGQLLHLIMSLWDSLRDTFTFADTIALKYMHDTLRRYLRMNNLSFNT